MKLFIYDRLDSSGKPKYQKIEISDVEAETWVQVNYEKSLAAAKPGEVVEKRTAQQIVDDICSEGLNADRREFAHAAKYQTVKNEDGEEVSILEMTPDDSYSPEECAEMSYYIELINNSLKPEYADILISVGLDNEDLKDYAVRIGINYETAKKRLQRAREKMKKII